MAGRDYFQSMSYSDTPYQPNEMRHQDQRNQIRLWRRESGGAMAIYMIFPTVSYTCTPQYFSIPAKDHAEAGLRSKKQGLVPTFQWRKLSTLINGIKRDPQYMRKPGELPPPGTVLHGVGPVSGILPKASQDSNQRK